jgi:AGCS family alanine or glycine:cation symporter
MNEQQWIQLFTVVDAFLWSKILIYLLIAYGLFLTLKFKGMQFRYLWYALKLAFTRKDREAEGDISQFQALMTALAATIGISSIAGVATAIVSGGFGAIFWMWLIALIGMTTKYAEALLAIKFRETDSRGEMCGGPMYYIEKGLNWKWLGVVFAFFGALSAFGGGNITQSNSIAHALKEIGEIPPLITGMVLSLLTASILLGGIKSIGKVSSILVPIMAVLYLSGGLIILIIHVKAIPGALLLILKSAFSIKAAGGGVIGTGISTAMQYGIARGVSSNEAGLGSGPIAAAAAKTDVPGRQALISMSSVFLSTLIVCSMTALVLAVTNVVGLKGREGELLNGVALVMEAFSRVIPYGKWIVVFSVIFFGFSTIIGWAYYGEKCFTYLFSQKTAIYYRIAFSLVVIMGAILSLDLVWPLVDITNGLMALPNIIGLFALANVVIMESERFFNFISSERKF